MSIIVLFVTLCYKFKLKINVSRWAAVFGTIHCRNIGMIIVRDRNRSAYLYYV